MLQGLQVARDEARPISKDKLLKDSERYFRENGYNFEGGYNIERF